MRRFAFELKMQDKSSYLLAADSESEMEEWINTLNKILHSSFELAMQEKRNGEPHDGMCVHLSVCVDFHYWTTQTSTTTDMTVDNIETLPTPLLTPYSHFPSLQSSEISQVSVSTLYVFGSSMLSGPHMYYLLLHSLSWDLPIINYSVLPTI